MQFKLVAASLLAVTGLSSSAPVEARQDTTNRPVVQEGDYIWKIDDFFARKPDGQKITSLGFNVKATNNGTADFDCSVSADPVEEGKFYECGPNSFIYFAYQQDRSGLLLKQDVSDEYVALLKFNLLGMGANISQYPICRCDDAPKLLPGGW